MADFAFEYRLCLRILTCFKAFGTGCGSEKFAMSVCDVKL